jgi:hypothetical protein
LGIYTKECKSIYKREACMSRLIVALFRVAKLWKQLRYPRTDERIKKIWYIYTMEYYLTIKKDKIMSFAGKCTELAIIMLRELRQVQKAKYCHVLTHLWNLNLK